MASWIEDIVSTLISDRSTGVIGIERSNSARLVTWLIVNIPPEYILFFFVIGFLWAVAFVAGSAFSTSRRVIGGVFSFLSEVFTIIDHVYVTWYATQPTASSQNSLFSEGIFGVSPSYQRVENSSDTQIASPAYRNHCSSRHHRRYRCHCETFSSPTASPTTLMLFGRSVLL